MLFPKTKIPNPHFGERIAAFLGDGWEIQQNDIHWIVSQKKAIDAFTNVSKCALIKGSVLSSLKVALDSVEVPSEHSEFTAAAQAHNYKHTEHTTYGFMARLFAGKTLFNLKPLSQLDQDDSAFLEELRKNFSLQTAVVYRKNLKPLLALLSLRKYAYLLSVEVNINFADMSKNEFWGAIPNGNDLVSYLDPFFVFSPITTGVPLDRFTTGIILVPEKTIFTPFEGSVGWADLLVTSPSGSTAGGVFALFGAENQLNGKQSEEYTLLLLEGLNSFLGWLLDPRNSCDASEIYNPGFGLQLISTVNSIFQSFSFCAKTIDGDEKQIHIFTALDRISNLAANWYHLKKGTLGAKTDALEASLFKKFFTEEFLTKVVNMLESHSEAPALQMISQSAEAALRDLKESLAPFDSEIGDLLRTVRNTSHGAFLRNDRFLKTFSQGPLKISRGVCVLGYAYMLCLLLAPASLLEALPAGES